MNEYVRDDGETMERRWLRPIVVMEYRPKRRLTGIAPSAAVVVAVEPHRHLDNEVLVSLGGIQGTLR